MVTIKQNTFNLEMDKYLEDIKRNKPESKSRKLNFFKKESKEEVPILSEEEVHIEYKEESFLKKLFAWTRRSKINSIEEELDSTETEELEEIEQNIEALEEEESQLREMEEELEDEKAGLLKRLVQKINFFKKRKGDDETYDVSELLEEEKPDFDEELKAVLKIAHSWLEKLSDKHKKEFKNSEDFQKYKAILIRYGLVREKKIEEEIEQPAIKTEKKEPIKRKTTKKK